ncbi:islet cell autoantigen 1-like isoform X2 [Watersipora subatra]|uniref:islet cell autoantigen 1-like isoform X2 n=1 Tax=Watersipora subatra TaxID=2589382 RepID=UPI00355C276B
MERGYSTHSKNLMRADLEKEDQSVLTQLKKAYWVTQHQIRKTMGKKEDEHVTASDADLDAKLELFKQIKISCIELLRVILAYQKRLVTLAKEENSMGKFLKSQSELDNTQAGKMMSAVGRSQTFSAQHRIQMRHPLYRLFQEVETFRARAVADTQMTVAKMEEARTEYRGALLWMKDVSARLDPEAFNKLDKFRKVQTEVRKAKEQFDKHKLDVLQKVDLLAASRSNMFSHALAAYQNSLLSFWQKMSRIMTAVSETFQGFQYYEFNVLKSELDVTTKELAKDTSSARVSELLQSLLHDTGENPTSEEDKLIYDIIMSLRDQHKTTQDTLIKPDSNTAQKKAARKLEDRRISSDSTTGLIDLEDSELDSEEVKVNEQFGEFQAAIDKETKEFELVGDGLSDKYSALREGGDDLLDDIFGPEQPLLHSSQDPTGGAMASLPCGFQPTDFLSNSDLSDLQVQGNTSSVPSSDLLSLNSNQTHSPLVAGNARGQVTSANKASQSMSGWFDLFADLDPLQDPDSVGKKVDVPNDGYNEPLKPSRQCMLDAHLGPCWDNEHLQMQV